jgi:hypothetical protein
MECLVKRTAIVRVSVLAPLAAGAAVGPLVAVGACGGAPTSRDFSAGDGPATGTARTDDASVASGDDANPGNPGEPAPGASDAGGVFLSADAATGGGSSCDLGAAASFATNADLNLFGQIVYYEDGGALPPGRYRAAYVDGCMKYDFIFNWQVQASTPDAGGGGFWLVGSTSDDRIVMPPGTTTSYADFDACVGANLATTPVEFEFDGGKMGVWLNDNPYVDNIAGDNGRNPKWRLTLLGACPPEFAPK